MKGNGNACIHEVELRERKWKGNAKLIVEAWGGVKIRALHELQWKAMRKDEVELRWHYMR